MAFESFKGGISEEFRRVLAILCDLTILGEILGDSLITVHDYTDLISKMHTRPEIRPCSSWYMYFILYVYSYNFIIKIN